MLNDKDLLTLRKYYIVYSKHTKLPYIDSKKRIYLIYGYDEALEFVNGRKGMFLEKEPIYYRISGLHTLCKTYDISGIVVIDANEKQTIPIDCELAEYKYYNGETKSAIMLLKELKDVSFLNELRFGHFLVPIRIEKRVEKQIPKIHYACASKPGENKKMCLAFTDFEEFEKWQQQVNDTWEVIEVNLHNLDRVRKTLPVLIDPLGNKLILTTSMIRGVRNRTLS